MPHNSLRMWRGLALTTLTSEPRHTLTPFQMKCLDPAVAVKSWRYGMAPAEIPVLLSQKPSTENGQFRVAGSPEISVEAGAQRFARG